MLRCTPSWIRKPEGPLPPHALRVVACLGDYLRNISGVSWRFNPSGVEHKLQWRGSIFFYELGGARIICRVVCRGGPFRQRPSDGHTHQVARGGKAWRPVSRASCYLTELSGRSTLSAAVSSAMIMVADASIVRSRLDGGQPRSKLRLSMRASMRLASHNKQVPRCLQGSRIAGMGVHEGHRPAVVARFE